MHCFYCSRFHEASSSNKIRQAPSSTVNPVFPGANIHTADSVCAAASSLLALNSRGGMGHRPSTVPACRASFNGIISKPIDGQIFTSTTTTSTTQQPQQQPAILHRRVRKPSSLLRLNQPMWGTENPPTNFAFPPPSASMVHHRSVGHNVSEVQVGFKNVIVKFLLFNLPNVPMCVHLSL